ncbi:hypothetical protein RAAC3_TM7C00001G0692 [Candidatus Saccharibacteria bacterium RAAC3_TM7_1]|nr:hypothetical protein RAAC3_TM7C00001G0692 [Candidatus Saccharibacteria bacterium RAAC3_TM7_1]
MAYSIQDARDAAKKRPSARTPEEQRMVDDNRGDQGVRNNDHWSKGEQKIHGRAKS